MPGERAAVDDERVELARLIDEVPDGAEAAVDEEIRAAEDAGELIERLEALIESHEAAERNLDEAVDAADSLDDLDDEVRASTDPTPSSEDGPVDRIRSKLGSVRDKLPGRFGSDESETSQDDSDPDRSHSLPKVAQAQRTTGKRLGELKYTFKNASPSEAALWGLGAGLAVANPAIAASYSTSMLLGGAIAGGIGLGAYQSSHEDTLLDDIDPLQIGQWVNNVTSKGGISEVEDEELGRLLGESTHLVEQLAPETYAQWVTEADPDAVIEGARYGARYEDELGGRYRGAAFGSGVGLLYGYASNEIRGRAIDPDELLNKGPGDLGSSNEPCK